MVLTPQPASAAAAAMAAPASARRCGLGLRRDRVTADGPPTGVQPSRAPRAIIWGAQAGPEGPARLWRLGRLGAAAEYDVLGAEIVDDHPGGRAGDHRRQQPSMQRRHPQDDARVDGE